MPKAGSGVNTHEPDGTIHINAPDRSEEDLIWAGRMYLNLPEDSAHRPLGTGTFRNRSEFVTTMGGVKKNLRDDPFTQANVIEYVTRHPTSKLDQANARQLRRWCHDFGFSSWRSLKDYLESSDG